MSEKPKFKEFRPASVAVSHQTSVLVLFFFVAVAGLLSYRAIPKESFPEFEQPLISVRTVYAGASPTDVESLVTREIEEELNTAEDLRELTSTTVEGYSAIIAEFETNVTIAEALQRVREKVDLAVADIPPDAEEPTISELIGDFPIMQVNISGEYDLVRLKEIGEDLQERFEALPQVLRANLRGGLEREVKVDVDLNRLQYYNLEFDDVLETIRRENVNIPGGSIDVNGVKYLVRVDGEFNDPATISDLVITAENGPPVYIRDIANVEFGFADRETFARLGGEPVVTLDIMKRSGENIIGAAEAVQGEIDAIMPELPPTTVISVTSNQAEDIAMMVSSLQNNIISGLLLIVGVLLFFLGLRTSIFVALSIPTSMFLSFVILGLLGITMNMVVLFSLILALGMLVDNAIVIVENIYRFVEEGWSRAEAAVKATGEVAGPVITATLTTLAAFAPLLFWPGMAGEFMKYLPITLIVTLSSSLFVALIIIPTLCSLFLRREGAPGPGMPRATRIVLIAALVFATAMIAASSLVAAGLVIVLACGGWLLYTRVLAGATKRFMDRGMPRLSDWYERQLQWCLGHRLLVAGGSVFMLIATTVVYGALSPPVEYFPEDIPPNVLLVDIEAPVGTSADRTDSFSRQLYAQLDEVPGLSEVESVVTTVGSTGGGGFSSAGGGPSGPESGRITLSMQDFRERSFDVFGTLGEMQETMGTDLAGVSVRVDEQEDGPPSGPAVNIEIIGEDPEALKRLAAQAVSIIERDSVSRKLVGLESSMDVGRPELRIAVDRRVSELYGISTNQVGFAVRGAINGIEAGKYRSGTEEYDIVVRLREEDRSALSDLANLTVFSEGRQVPILSVADWAVAEGYGSIQRKDLDRVATVSAEARTGYNSEAVRAEVEGTLAGFEAGLPPGYSMRFTGEQVEQQEAQDFLMSAFMAALMLIALILVYQFNSVTKPLIILSSVVLSTIGVMIGLLVFDKPFVIIMTGVGIISLAGIVVNNAIVLIDYIDVLRKRDGLPVQEALLVAGRRRLRPVLLTALTTALGLVPLAIGLNFDFFGLFSSLSPDLYWGGEQAAWWGPMAIAVIAGILFATFLTLVLVPVMYSLVDQSVAFAKRVFISPAEDAGPESPLAGPQIPADQILVGPATRAPAK